MHTNPTGNPGPTLELAHPAAGWGGFGGDGFAPRQEFVVGGAGRDSTGRLLPFGRGVSFFLALPRARMSAAFPFSYGGYAGVIPGGLAPGPSPAGSLGHEARAREAARIAERPASRGPPQPPSPGDGNAEDHSRSPGERAAAARADVNMANADPMAMPGLARLPPRLMPRLPMTLPAKRLLRLLRLQPCSGARRLAGVPPLPAAPPPVLLPWMMLLAALRPVPPPRLQLLRLEGRGLLPPGSLLACPPLKGAGPLGNFGASPRAFTEATFAAADARADRDGRGAAAVDDGYDAGGGTDDDDDSLKDV